MIILYSWLRHLTDLSSPTPVSNWHSSLPLFFFGSFNILFISPRFSFHLVFSFLPLFYSIVIFSSFPRSPDFFLWEPHSIGATYLLIAVPPIIIPHHLGLTWFNKLVTTDHSCSFWCSSYIYLSCWDPSYQWSPNLREFILFPFLSVIPPTVLVIIFRIGIDSTLADIFSVPFPSCLVLKTAPWIPFLIRPEGHL